MTDGPAGLGVEVMSDGGARRLLSLRSMAAVPGVGDTMTLPDGQYLVLRRHWCVGPPSGPGGVPDEYAPSVGTVEVYVRKVTFTGEYGRKVGRPGEGGTAPAAKG